MPARPPRRLAHARRPSTARPRPATSSTAPPPTAPHPRPPPLRPRPRSCPPPPTSTSARRSPMSSPAPAPSARCARSLAPSLTCASTRPSRPSSPCSRWSTTASASCSRWPSILARTSCAPSPWTGPRGSSVAKRSSTPDPPSLFLLGGPPLDISLTLLVRLGGPQRGGRRGRHWSLARQQHQYLATVGNGRELFHAPNPGRKSPSACTPSPSACSRRSPTHCCSSFVGCSLPWTASTRLTFPSRSGSSWSPMRGSTR